MADLRCDVTICHSARSSICLSPFILLVDLQTRQFSGARCSPTSGSNILSLTLHLKFYTGEHDLNGDEGYEQRPEIEKIINHPKYSAHNNHDYDVALIKLKSPISYNSRVRPVCLPKFEFGEGTSCYISGWGHTQEGGDVPQVGLHRPTHAPQETVALLQVLECALENKIGTMPFD